MASAVQLSVIPVVRRPTDLPGWRARHRLSRRALGVVKMLALMAAATFVVAWQARPLLKEKLADPASGIEIRFPAGWSGNRWSTSGIEACALPGDIRSGRPRMPPSPTTGCRVALERALPSDFEQICRILGGMDLEPGWSRDESSRLAHVAVYLGMGGSAEQAQIEPLSIAGRPALMLTAPRYGGWGSVVLASGGDIAFIHIYFPTIEDRRRLWPTWRAMVRSVRLVGTPAPIGVDWIPREP